MIWRSAIVAAYVALAIFIGIAFGLQGLFVLLFFYVWAAVFVLFMLAWGRIASAVGRGYFGMRSGHF